LTTNTIILKPSNKEFVLDKTKLIHSSLIAGLSKNLRSNISLVNRDDLICKIVRNPSGINNALGVTFNDFDNPSSQYNCFWIGINLLVTFCEQGILKYKENSFVINNNEEEIIMEDFKVVKISFCEGSNTSSVYPYALIDDMELTVGDLVVVKPAHHPITLARVVGFENEPSANDVHFASQGREIINKVDTSAYEQRIKNRKRKAELKREMDKLVSENKELVLYAAVAENNPKMAELLNEYKNLI
jgi:hypothetical protein